TALDIIRTIPRSERDELFGARTAAGYTAWDYGRDALDRRLAGKVKRPWQLRDIRRTVATRLADLQVLPHVIEATLNHRSGFRRGVAGVYNRAEYRREVTEALARWNDHVLALAAGRAAKVVPMRRA